MGSGRRGFLKAGLGATALFAPLPYAWVWAQSNQEGTLKLLKAPKVALVVGNSKYKDAPELKNPANDARGIGETLKGAGFEVTTLLDTGREQLIEAIRSYVRAMEQKKAVGLFYFAGHGVQLAWRNYLLPVDAVIDKIDDVAKQSVDIARLMEGLTKAGNAMNVIILDACRDNPFGKDFRVEQKGLSQMDAPTHTILAYATSPGNVASDGDGSNGLYTENLLREMKVPEAKIEDVFKRVRLGVRRRTNGAQIPWESTSLEDDFWFLPPKELKAFSDAERTRRFDIELALYETIKDSSNPALLEDYLQRYPSGNFSELVLLQLNRVLARQGEKRVQVTSQEGNPFTQGAAEFNTNMRVGDSYSYQILDLYSKAVQRTMTSTVEQVVDADVIFSDGLVTDLLGNVRKYPDGRVPSANQAVPVEFSVGKRWISRSRLTTGRGIAIDTVLEYWIAAKETITVPAGTFNAFRIERQGYGLGSPGGQLAVKSRQWWVPDRIRRPVAAEDLRTLGGNRVLEATRTELVSFKQT